jgi:glycosyltransferase involved in cell wall biosynthesis
MKTMTQKRLAIFLHGLYEGGAERTLLNLAEGMTGLGYAVDLVLARAAGPFLSQIPEQVRMIDLKSPRVLYSLNALTRYIRKERPDALISAIDYTNITALWAKRIVNIPKRLVVVEQNNLSHRVDQMPYYYREVIPRLIRLSYPWAKCIVAVSQGVADDLASSTGLRHDSIQVIYNPIITQEIRRKSQETLSHPWFQAGQPPVLLAVGRLTAQKDFPTLLHAFAKVRRDRIARLMILGEGEERQTLETLVKSLELNDDVCMPGFVDNPYAFMAHAAAFILSSKWEGLPTVLVEALYCGKPVIATDCPSGPREILKDGLFGQLISIGDPVKMAQAIEYSLDGKLPAPPPISWNPYTLENIVDQYNQALFGI